MTVELERAVDISRALKVPGWLEPVEMYWLACQAAKRQDIVEVGSWRGRSTRAMADNTAGTIHCVDTWQDYVGLAGWWSTPEDAAKRSDRDWVFKEFNKNLHDHIYQNVKLHRMTSRQAAEEMASESFDLIFIDADHSYDSVKEDIQLWRPLLREGGVFCGHDYNSWTNAEVVAAVNDFIKNFTTIGTIWIAV